MITFSQKHPILFGILLFFIALLAVVPFSVAGGVLGMPEAGSAVGRIVVGVVLILVFRSCFRQGRPFSGLVWMAPALLFPLWNIVYHLASGMGATKPAVELPLAVLFGLAPAVFEETIFRGILIAKLRENGRSPMSALLISAVLFGAVHLTNVAGMRPIDALVQTGYAVVVGLVLGAIYLKSGDLLAVILTHALIDVSSQIFVSAPGETSVPMLLAFVLILAAEAGYALWLTGRIQKAEQMRSVVRENNSL